MPERLREKKERTRGHLLAPKLCYGGLPTVMVVRLQAWSAPLAQLETSHEQLRTILVVFSSF